MRGWLLMLAFAVGVAAQPGDRVIRTDSSVRGLAFSADGMKLSGAGGDGKVRTWDAETGKLLRTTALPEATRAFAFAPGADRYASFTRGAGLRLVDLNSGKVIRELAKGETPQSRPTFSSDASVLLTSSRDKKVRLWDAASGKERLAIAGGIGGVSAAAFSPDGSIVVAADNDTDVRVWSVRNGELLRRIEELAVTTFAMAFSPDGKYLASGGADRTIYIWDAKTWKLLRKMPRNPEMISALAFSPDGKLIATGGFNDQTSKMAVSVLLRDAGTGDIVRTMPSTSQVTATTFSPDGKWLATTNLDNSIALWRVSGSAK